jgi:hypothetical protein
MRSIMAVSHRIQERSGELLNQNRCPIDDRGTQGNDVICEDCAKATRLRLAQIPVLYLEASAYLEPGRGGSGSSGSERTIGVNLAALGFRQGASVLSLLEEWERTVRVEHLGQVELEGVEREERPQVWNRTTQKYEDAKLTEQEWLNEHPIVRRGSVGERIQGVCEFLLVHAKYLATHPAAGDFTAEVASIHGQGESATRRIAEKVTRIKCPGLVEQWRGEEMKQVTCDQKLTLSKDYLEMFPCKNCGREWTTLRLVAVALDTPGYSFLLDSEAIAQMLGVTARHVLRIAEECGAVTKLNSGDKLYDLMKIYRYRSAHAE